MVERRHPHRRLAQDARKEFWGGGLQAAVQQRGGRHGSPAFLSRRHVVDGGGDGDPAAQSTLATYCHHVTLNYCKYIVRMSRNRLGRVEPQTVGRAVPFQLRVLYRRRYRNLKTGPCMVSDL